MTVNTEKSVDQRHVSALFWLSIISTFYFILMNWIGAARANYQVIQVVIELFTIPMLLIAMGCFVFAIISWINEKFRILSRPFYSLVVLTILFIYFIFIS